MAQKRKKTPSAQARELLAQGLSKPEVRRRTGLSRQALEAAAAARSDSIGRPRKHGPDAERVQLYVSAECAAWLRAEAQRDGCSLGDVVDGCRLAILAADAGNDPDLRLARRGLRAAFAASDRDDQDDDLVTELESERGLNLRATELFEGARLAKQHALALAREASRRRKGKV